MDKLSDAATQEQQDGQEPVAPAFNKAATEAITQKDAMTTEAAMQSDPIILETARLIAPREDLSDEAFAAIKRGDAPRLKTLLDDGLDVNTRDEQGYTLLMRATQEGETEMAQDLLLRKADPNARADSGLTALMLASTNGNVEIAQLILEELDDDELDDLNDEIAEELALEHGNMAVYFAIQQRRRRSEFNKAALDENDHGRKPEARCEHHESAFIQFFSSSTFSITDTIKKDAHIVAAAVSHGAHVVSQATVDTCHAAMQFCSQFFHHKVQEATASDPEMAAQAAEIEKQVDKSVSLLTRLLNLNNTGGGL